MEVSSLIPIIAVVIFVITIITIIAIVIRSFKNFYIRTGLGQVVNAAKNSKQLERDEYSRPKDVVGMTKLVEPRIVEDFPGFNKDLLYSKAEGNLRKIFNCYENKSSDFIEKDPEFVLIKGDIEARIEDLKTSGIDVKYDMLKFHRHALKSYRKTSGVATVEVSSTLQYYYSENGNDNVKMAKHINDALKQTRYTTTFVYGYDESKFEEKENVFGLNCPNCGAPLNRSNTQKCEFCGTHIEDINLKVWKMSAFSEDYK